MTESLHSQFLDDPEFQSLLVGCLESLQRGETIDRDALAKDFPKFAEEVGRFLDDRQLLEKAASDFRDVSPSRIAISAYENTMDSNSGPSDFTIGASIWYLGEYEILKEIARGGMGVVFQARQQKLNRIVALKMILAGRLADSGDVKRFYREARAAGRLNHPNIVPVHEVGEHDGRHYFTMDYVEGRSLADTIRDETLAPRDAATLIRTTAEAVHYAHQQGTVHRDLKPGNILVDANGQPKVTDFGLAKMLSGVDNEIRAELTASGQILGTPSYMSPEQALGKQELVGPASDIYSLGAILYATLAGRAPFVADSPVDTLLQVMNTEPVSPRELNPSVPKDLETICLKCLNKEPHRRYGTAQLLAEDLGRFLQGRPVLARPKPGNGGTVRRVTYSPDGRLLFSAGTGIAVWNVQTGELSRRLGDEALQVSHLIVAADSLTVLTAESKGAITLWKTNQSEPVRSVFQVGPPRNALDIGDRIKCLDLSPDGARYLYADAFFVHVRNVETGETVCQLRDAILSTQANSLEVVIVSTQPVRAVKCVGGPAPARATQSKDRCRVFCRNHLIRTINEAQPMNVWLRSEQRSDCRPDLHWFRHFSSLGIQVC